MSENKIELRKLCAKDLFPMMKILSKIGISEFKKCFESVEGKIDIKDFDTKGEEAKDSIFRRVGITVMLDIADVLMKNIGSCEREIYSFLGSLSGMKPEEISKLDMAVFAEMIIDLVTKEEFRDFFTVVAGFNPTAKSN